jgi:hypothetical protein
LEYTVAVEVADAGEVRYVGLVGAVQKVGEVNVVSCG